MGIIALSVVLSLAGEKTTRLVLGTCRLRHRRGRADADYRARRYVGLEITLQAHDPSVCAHLDGRAPAANVEGCGILEDGVFRGLNRHPRQNHDVVLDLWCHCDGDVRGALASSW